MSLIQINDIFDDLINENNRLLNELVFSKDVLKFLNDFKSFIDCNSYKIQPNLESNEWQKFEELCKQLHEFVVKINAKSNDNKNQSIEDIVTNDGIGTEENTKNSSKRQMVCNDCGKQFSREKWFKNHLKSHQKNDIKNDKNGNEELEEYNELKILGNKESNEKLNSESEDKTKKSVKRKGKGFKKKISGFVTKSEVNVNSVLICNVCGKRFRKQNVFDYHVWKHKNEKRFKCDFPDCQFQTDHRWGMKYHINAHTGNRPFSCTQCDKTYGTKYGLKIHTKTIHELAGQPLICHMDGCNRQYRSRAALRNHQKVYHLKDKPFVCDHCDYKTSFKASLVSHLSSHSSDRRFVCPIDGCDKTYKTDKDLQIHVKRHTYEYNFKCTHEGCGRAFQFLHKLNYHIKIDHSDVLHRCDWPGCEYSHRRKDVLANHAIRHSQELPVACSWPQCDKRFKAKKYLGRHLMIHRGDKRHACYWPGCQYRCVTPGNLSQHMRVHQKT